MIGETVSHYRIVSRLGQGGMGEVYLAEDTELDREVALKFMAGSIAADDGALERFRREAKAAAGLRHPNIVTVYEIGDHAGRPYIAMEHVEGDAIADLVAAGSLDTRQTVEIAIGVCEGLAEAHAAGVVHRDLKPANVRVDRAGRAKILDFGLARSVDAATLTEAGTTVGTLRYMSPEQARGERVDARSDIFSLGAMIYEMLAAKPPFNAEHAAAIAYAIQNEHPQPLARYCRDATPELERIVFKALAKDPGARYQTAADMAADLRQTQSSASYPAPAATRAGSRRWMIPTAVAVLAVLLVLVVQQWLGDPAEAEPNTLAIMYFENVADREDPQRFGEIATNLLITDLSESQFIHVLSSQRLYDILRFKGKEGVRVIDRDTAGEVARHAGVRQMLLGSILRTEPNIVITSQLVDVASGEVVGSQRVTGEPGQDVFALVDRLSRDVRDDLGLPRAARREEDTPVAEVTTHSEEAYRYYVIGLEATNRLFYDEADEAFLRAVEIDSTFAMAWLQLSKRGNVFLDNRSDRLRRQALEQAVRYADRVGRKERRYIAARQAEAAGDVPRALAELEAIVDEFPDEEDAHYEMGRLYQKYTGDVDRAIHHYRRVTEIDPLNAVAHNQLAYRYGDLRNFEKAIWAVNQYVELASDEPNPYDSRGDIYAHFGAVDSARSSYRKAYAVNPYFSVSQVKVAGLYMLERDYDRAELELEEILNASNTRLRSFARLAAAALPAHQGKMQEMAAALERGMELDRREGLGDDWRFVAKCTYLGVAYLKIGKLELGLAAFDSLAVLTAGSRSILHVRWRDYYAYELARLGRITEAEAQLERLEGDIRAIDLDWIDAVYLTRSGVELMRRDITAARRWAQQALASGDGARDDCRLVIALCDLESGDANAAAGELEFQCNVMGPNRQLDSYLAAELHYHLARAYEGLGEADKAAARYTEFLDIWDAADPEIQLKFPDPRDPDNRPLEFARRRLQALRAGI